MQETIYAICLDEELEENPNYWVIAEDYSSRNEAEAQSTLDVKKKYRVTKNSYSGMKCKSEKYAVEGLYSTGGVYILTKKENK